MNIWVIATLDTKFAEADFIRKIIEGKNHHAIIVDPGSSGIPGIQAEITREEVTLAGGQALSDLTKRNDKAYSQQIMREGLINLIGREFAQGNVDGVISVGGGQGTALATAAMQTLPFGIPKVMVSKCCDKQFGPYSQSDRP